MLNKELLMMGGLMMGGAEEWWTLRFKFTGDSYINLELWDPDGNIIWKGTPSTHIETVQIPPESTLMLYMRPSGAYNVLNENGCLVESSAVRRLEITVFQNKAYLEVHFTA